MTSLSEWSVPAGSTSTRFHLTARTAASALTLIYIAVSSTIFYKKKKQKNGKIDCLSENCIFIENIFKRSDENGGQVGTN